MNRSSITIDLSEYRNEHSGQARLKPDLSGLSLKSDPVELAEAFIEPRMQYVSPTTQVLNDSPEPDEPDPCEYQSAPRHDSHQCVACIRRTSWARRRAKELDEASSTAVSGNEILRFDDVRDVIANDDGTDEEPSLGILTSGNALFYASATNSIFGETTSGKTFIAMLCMVQEIQSGNNVIFLDYESSPRRIFRRLRKLGASEEALSRHLHRARPETRFSERSKKEIEETVKRLLPSLVVIDSVGESLATQGANPNADEEVANWFTLAPNLIASFGPAVLLIDHVSKNAGGRWPIGSQRKLAAISGASYVCESKESFSKEKSGRSLLTVAKDREGFRAVGEVAAALKVSVTLDVQGAPAGSTFELVEGRGTTRIGSISEQIVSALGENPGLTTSEVASLLKRDPKNTRKDLANLMRSQRVSRDESTKPYRWSIVDQAL